MNDFQRLQEAFIILLSDDAPNDMRRAAQIHVDGVAAQDNEGLFCLDLFLGLSKSLLTDHASGPRTHEIRFWCLQVLGRVLPSLTSAARRCLSERLWTEYFEGVVCKLQREEIFVLNKYLSNQVAEIALDYPGGGVNLFGKYLEKIGSLAGSLAAVPAVQAFLQLNLQLDSELIADEVSSRTEEERAAAMRIKDGLRQGDINMILELCHSVFTGSIFGVESVVAKRVEGQANLDALPAPWIENAALALRVLARVSVWVDTALLVSEGFRFIDFYRLAMSNTFGLTVAEAAYETFHGLVYKKMDGAQKTLLLKQFNLIQIFVDSVQTVSDPTVRVKQATVLNTVCDQILDSLADVIQCLKKELDNSHPYRLHLTHAEFADVYRELWSLLLVCASLALQFFAPPGEADAASVLTNVQTAERVTPALHKFFRTLRVALKDPEQSGGLPQPEAVKPLLVSAFVTILGRARIPDVLNWDEFAEEPEEFFSPEEDDGSDVSAFFVCRHAALQLCRKVFSVALLCGGLAGDVLSHLEAKVTDFRALEGAIYIHIACLEAYKDSLNAPAVRPLVTRSVALALSWKPLIEDPACPPLPRIAYFDLLGRLSLMFKQGAKNVDFPRDRFVSEGLAALLTGLQATNSRRALSVAIRELLRFARSVQGAVPTDAVTVVQRLGYLDVEPLPLSALPAEDWEEAIGGSWLSTTYLVSRPLLSLEDQSRVYELVGFLAADKKPLLDQLLTQLVQTADAHLTTALADERIGTEWLVRLLRCCGNLLKTVSDMSDLDSVAHRLMDILVFAIDRLGGPGRVQQNVLFVARRLVAAGKPRSLGGRVVQLIKAAYVNAQRYTRVIDNDKRVPAAVEGLSAFLCSVITAWTEEGFVDVLMAEVEPGTALFDWCVSRHVEFSHGSEPPAEVLNLLQTAAAKCPVGFSLLIFYQQLRVTSPTVTPSGVAASLLPCVEPADYIGWLLSPSELTHVAAGCLQAYVQLFVAVQCDPSYVDKCRVMLTRLRGSIAAVLAGSFVAKDRETLFAGLLQADCFRVKRVISACVDATRRHTPQDPPGVRFTLELMSLLKLIFSYTLINSSSKTPTNDILLRKLLERYRQPALQALSNIQSEVSVEKLIESAISCSSSKELRECYYNFISGSRPITR